MCRSKTVGVWLTWLLLAWGIALGRAEVSPLVQCPWSETRSTHFHTYSCGPTQEVAKLTARLEQFCTAYALLAGTQAIASPPIVVLAFPNQAAMEPFLPLYRGKAANLAGFFCRNSDENLIVLSLPGPGTGSLETIFHEYTHLLLRHNERFWPLWLKEGMADIYATFEVTGAHSARVGKPMAKYLTLLQHQPMASLRELFAITSESPGYNERERQGRFYAQSWLLTHYLMLGPTPGRKAQFGQLMPLLRQGLPLEAAFTNTFRASLPELEQELRVYLQTGRFEPLTLEVRANLYAPQPLATRPLLPVEACFRLGDELLRVGRPEAAETYFARAQQLAPASPLAFEGLGLLAAERSNHAQAIHYLRQALQCGPTSFLAHYIYARERLRLTASVPDTFSRVDGEAAAEIRTELKQALALMPDFGPAHHLLGLFELVQGEDAVIAEAHLQRAIQLEPENAAYLLTLAQAQIFRKDAAAARRTLEALRRPYIEAPLRRHAEELLAKLNSQKMENRR